MLHAQTAQVLLLLASCFSLLPLHAAATALWLAAVVSCCCCYCCVAVGVLSIGSREKNAQAKIACVSPAVASLSTSERTRVTDSAR